jgi:hypothetical protein
MKKFEVTVLVRVEAEGLLTVKAKDEDEALARVQAMIDDGKLCLERFDMKMPPGHELVERTLDESATAEGVSEL